MFCFDQITKLSWFDLVNYWLKITVKLNQEVVADNYLYKVKTVFHFFGSKKENLLGENKVKKQRNEMWNHFTIIFLDYDSSLSILLSLLPLRFFSGLLWSCCLLSSYSWRILKLCWRLTNGSVRCSIRFGTWSMVEFLVLKVGNFS